MSYLVQLLSPSADIIPLVSRRKVDREGHRLAYGTDLVRKHVSELCAGGELSSGLRTASNDVLRRTIEHASPDKYVSSCILLVKTLIVDSSNLHSVKHLCAHRCCTLLPLSPRDAVLTIFHQNASQEVSSLFHLATAGFL